MAAAKPAAKRAPRRHEAVAADRAERTPKRGEVLPQLPDETLAERRARRRARG
jgi:hypothetical protein